MHNTAIPTDSSSSRISSAEESSASSASSSAAGEDVSLLARDISSSTTAGHADSTRFPGQAAADLNTVSFSSACLVIIVLQKWLEFSKN